MYFRDALCLTVLLCLACSGTQVVRGKPPIVRMNELSQTGEDLTVQLSMRNLNGVQMNIQSIDFKLSVEDTVLFSYRGSADNIIANGTEVREVKVKADKSGLELLEGLQNGEVRSLPYTLEGSVTTVGDGILRYQYNGHLYPVPGRPGRFR